MHVDAADDRRSDCSHGEEAVFPTAVVRRSFVQAEEIL